MILTLVVRPEVDGDLLEAEKWYDQQQPGLGQKFLGDVIETIDRLLQNFFLYWVRHRRSQVRWVFTHRFPYKIIFRVIDDTVIVYAVIHAARDERNWKTRLEL